MGRLRGLRAAALASDLVAAIVANASATWIRSQADSLLSIQRFTFTLDWSVLVICLAVAAAFYALGLYEWESFASRPVSLWATVRGSFYAFVAAALVIYLLKSDRVDQSRLILGLTFVLFLFIDLALRLGVLDRLYVSWVRRSKPVSFLVGDSREAQNLAERLSELRGFSRVETLKPDSLRPEMGEALAKLLDQRESKLQPADSLFVDTLSVQPREVFELTHVARERGVEVYVLSGLLGPLEGSRLLGVLFQAPVIRVKRSMDKASAHLFKRVFDVVGSSVLLILASPLIAALAMIIKLSSPGPVFYWQTRVGRFGMPFRFYKFRSMYRDNDDSDHERYVKAFMAGEAEQRGDGDNVYKMVDDPRITPIGRIIRKYSLDEIPQFFNVLRGDMSLVGPRPPLPYEVDEYDEWHELRLSVPPGITGMWQVEGRSRVSFDEMILQDLMYAKNMSLLVDVKLCLRTVPAALLGYGGG